MTVGFAEIQSKIDRWQNHWQGSVAVGVSTSVNALKAFNPTTPPQGFFETLDAAFSLFAPRKASPKKRIEVEEGTVENTVNLITRSYWQARDANEHQLALRTGIAFNNFSPMFQGYHARQNSTHVIDELYDKLIFSPEALMLYQDLLKAGIAKGTSIDLFNHNFLRLLQTGLNEQSLQQVRRLLFNRDVKANKNVPWDKDYNFVLRFNAIVDFFEARPKERTAENLLRFADPKLIAKDFHDELSYLKAHISPLDDDKSLNKAFSALYKIKDRYWMSSDYSRQDDAIEAFLDLLDRRPGLAARLSKIIELCEEHYTSNLQNLAPVVDVFLEARHFSDNALKIGLDNLTKAIGENVFGSTFEIAANLGDIVLGCDLQGTSPDKFPVIDTRPFLFDQGPWPRKNYEHYYDEEEHYVEQNNEELRVCFNQSRDIIKSFQRRSNSSIAEAGMCMRNGDMDSYGQPTLFYKRFIDWLKPDYLVPTEHQAHKDFKFPGNGWSFGDLNLSKEIRDYVSKATAFNIRTFPGEAELDSQDRFDRAQQVLGALSSATVLKLRGMTVISPDPEDSTYNLVSSQGSVPYSLIAYNNHFANPTTTTALLVPTKYLRRNLSPQKMAEALRPEKLRLHDDVLDLGSSSALNGGLCNTRQPYSEPYFAWQETLNQYHDLTGHAHKWNLIINRFNEFEGSLRSLSNPQFLYEDGDLELTDEEIEAWGRKGQNILNELQDDHKKIYDISHRYKSMLLQLDLLESLFTKGVKNINGDAVRFNAGRVLSNFAKWQKHYQTNIPEDMDKRVVLLDADTFNKSAVPDWSIRLDPVENTYETRDEAGNIEKHALPTDKIERAKLLNPAMLAKNGQPRTLRFYPYFSTAA